MSHEIAVRKTDVRTDVVSEAEYKRNCELYADWAFYTPPERFLFRHYDEPADQVLICQRPMVGIERYVVTGLQGGHYGIYDTRDVTMYLKTGTWIEVADDGHFLRSDIAELERSLAEKRRELDSVAQNSGG